MMQTAEAGWAAHLNLVYQKRDKTTILAENLHRGPLTVQRPLYPEKDVCHTYILHPPGGVVGGDTLNISVKVDSGAAALITTPGATKFYRTNGNTAHQIQQLVIQDGCLEWFPQDSIIFPGAIASLTTEIHLSRQAQFIGWEIIGLGLPSQEKYFTSGTLVNSLTIFRDTQPVLIDKLRVDKESDLHSRIGLRSFPVSASFLATPVDKQLHAELHNVLPKPSSSSLIGLTLKDDLLIGRYLGNSTFEARDVFEQLWSNLRPLFNNRKPCPPRIWAT